MKTIAHLTAQIYGSKQGPALATRIDALMQRWRNRIPPRARIGCAEGMLPLGEGDTVLIAYGDQFHGPPHDQTDARPNSPLGYLHRFMNTELEKLISGVHILPFSPYSSDDGFSVIDYRQVDAAVGDWKDIEALGSDYRFMADLVLNHCSAQSEWFQAFMRDETPYRDYFITVAPGSDTSMVFRPRALPLLHPFQTAAGEQVVWTTFSSDQVDLNYANPEVLLEMLDILLQYVASGARVIRLDAIAYVWKELGTSCLHHPNAHAIVRLFRAVLATIAPGVLIITETNVPHEENISYFGAGDDEAHLVYNFSLPPLTLDAFLRGDAQHLSRWAATLSPPSPGVAFFNFLASHDGIGLLPARGYLSRSEMDNLLQTVLRRGGRISTKMTADGEIPYEANINYLSAITDPDWSIAMRAAAFLTAQAIMLAMAGLPAIYVHSLVGSLNWQAGVEQTGANRAINRQKLGYDQLLTELATAGSLRNVVFAGYKRLLRARAAVDAFHPGRRAADL